MSRRRKKRSPVGMIVLMTMLALLALLVVYRFVSLGMADTADASPSPVPTDAAPTPTPYEEHLESGVIIRPLQTPTPAPGTTPAPTEPGTTPTSAPIPTPESAVIIDNQGALEIILPDDMESDGF